MMAEASLIMRKVWRRRTCDQKGLIGKVVCVVLDGRYEPFLYCVINPMPPERGISNHSCCGNDANGVIRLMYLIFPIVSL